jgi:hypothetical protein
MRTRSLSLTPLLEQITVRTPLPTEWKGKFLTAETLGIISSQLEREDHNCCDSLPV